MYYHPRWLLVLINSLAVFLALNARPSSAHIPQPTPTVDRLAIPVLPENPTQVDVGRNLYYYHCMPCHGDYGQGLTDEFRHIWVEDHRNCWKGGCHGGREKDEGFPLPRAIPALNVTARSRELFPQIDDLYEYLRRTHPPQRPGTLSEEEYRALAVYVFTLAGRQEALARMGLENLVLRGLAAVRIAALLLGALLFALAIRQWFRARREGNQ